jgi:intergrase/recombinase
MKDDASRKILSIREFDNTTTENSIEVLKEAEKQAEESNAVIEAINTDRGAQFYPNKKDKNGEADSVFQNYLESKGIIHSHRGKTILRPIARLKDLFRHIGTQK